MYTGSVDKVHRPVITGRESKSEYCPKTLKGGALPIAMRWHMEVRVLPTGAPSLLLQREG